MTACSGEQKDPTTMPTRYDDELGTYTQWAEAFSDKGLDKALADQAALRRGQLNDGNDHVRYTPSQGTQRACDTVRVNRDDLEFRDWNSDAGFFGASRARRGPGMVGRGAESAGQQRRRAKVQEVADGF